MTRAKPQAVAVIHSLTIDELELIRDYRRLPSDAHRIGIRRAVEQFLPDKPPRPTSGKTA